MTTANPHLRAIVIAGVLALTAGALGFYTLSRQNSAIVQPPAVPTTARHAATTTTAPTAPARTTPAAKSTPTKTTPAKAAAKPAAPAAKPKAKPAPPRPAPVVRAALAYGLPAVVARQFAGHDVVVVSLYSSQATVDVSVQAEAEAEAGATLGGAGFAAVDVSKEGASGVLAKLVGIVDPPATLVFARPDDAAVAAYAAAEAAQPQRSTATAQPKVAAPEFPLAVKLVGFNDRDTIAQAARDADPNPGEPVERTVWATKAAALCTSASKRLDAAGPVKTKKQLGQQLPLYRSVSKSFLASLAALSPPAGHEQDVARFVDLERRDVALTEQLATATLKGDAVSTATLGVQENSVARQAGALATELGAAACGQGL